MRECFCLDSGIFVHILFLFFFSSINQANLSFVVGLKNGEVIFLHQSQKNSENFQENKDKHG